MKDYLPIGTYVQCSGKVVICKPENKRNIVAVGGFIEGYIVGGSYIKEGIIEYDSDYISFKHTKTVFVYRVSVGFINKPILVLPEQISFKHVQDNPTYSKFVAQRWTDRERELLSRDMKDIMKDWPRDAKGRWMKAKGEEA